MGRKVKQAMPEAESDAVGVEVCRCVVAEEFRVAKDETGLVVVIGVPSGERQDRRG